MSGPALITTAALVGLKRAEAKVERSAERIAKLPLTASDPGDEVHLSEEIVSMIQARNAFEANIETLKTAAEIESHAIDLLG